MSMETVARRKCTSISQPHSLTRTCAALACALSLWTHNSERVGWRRPPLQHGLALAPALTCCLVAAHSKASRITDSRH